MLQHTCLPMLETMPAVTLFCRVRGLPRARTHSPTRMLLLLPISTVGSGTPASIFTKAKSEALPGKRSVAVLWQTVHCLSLLV